MRPEEAIIQLEPLTKLEKKGDFFNAPIISNEEQVEAIKTAIEALSGISKPAGEWIRSEETFEDLSGTFETYTRSTCSICNQANGWGEVPYCPWCGAKMEKKDDGHGETDQEQRG